MKVWCVKYFKRSYFKWNCTSRTNSYNKQLLQAFLELHLDVCQFLLVQWSYFTLKLILTRDELVCWSTTAKFFGSFVSFPSSRHETRSRNHFTVHLFSPRTRDSDRSFDRKKPEPESEQRTGPTSACTFGLPTVLVHRPSEHPTSGTPTERSHSTYIRHPRSHNSLFFPCFQSFQNKFLYPFSFTFSSLLLGFALAKATSQIPKPKRPSSAMSPLALFARRWSRG